MSKEFSLSDLDASIGGAKLFEFEYAFKNGKGSGVFLSILGAESEEVARETAALMAAERAKQEFDGEKYKFDANELGKRLAAIRIKAWRGIKEECTPENALKLCLSNKEVADQVIKHSDNFGNFIRL